MMTLHKNLQFLYDLQQIDTQIVRAKRTLAGLDNGDEAKVVSEAAKLERQKRLDFFHHRSGELKDSELKLATLETKLKTYQQKLYQISSPKELSNIEKEIEALGRQRSTLDERILELMDEVEAAKVEAATAEAAAKVAEDHYTQVRSAYLSRSKSLTAEAAELTTKRTAFAEDAPDVALLKRYDDIRAKSQGIGIAKIADKCCGGCHMTLPSTLILTVKEGEELQTCENCRRILFI